MNQIALSLTLIFVASLFARTLRNLQHIDLGFQRENIIICHIDPTRLGYRGQRLRTFYDQLLESVRALPNVRAAALSAVTPLSNYLQSVSIRSGPTRSDLDVGINQVSSGYFTTLGIPLLVGRDFRPEDEPRVITNDGVVSGDGGGWVDTSTVCIMDEALARQLFGTANAVGRLFYYPGSDRSKKPGIEVVGVVKDAHYGELLRPDEQGTLYEPSWSNGAGSRVLEVRFVGSNTPVIAGLRRALRDQDPDVPLLEVRTMEYYIDSRLAHERLVAYLCSFFGTLALALTAVGLYGVIAYVVTQRTREIGIRMALGARWRDVAAMILRVSVAPVAAGVVLGLAASFCWGLFLGSLLYGVDPFDHESPLLAVMAISAAVLLACYIPVRRATKVDPMVALRYE